MSNKLLLIDDDSAFLQVMGKALSKRGFDVMRASCAATALEQAKENPPDFAVVDLKLESESGLDLIPRLKEINTDMVVVVVTIEHIANWFVCNRRNFLLKQFGRFRVHRIG